MAAVGQRELGIRVRANARTLIQAAKPVVTAVPREPHRRRLLAIISEAFELTPRQVLVDAMVIDLAARPETAVCTWLRQRHGWDESLPPYYLVYLRRLMA